MNVYTLPHPNKYLVVEPLDYPNPYDFRSTHRHDYFEIILIKKGGGKQLIDFKDCNLNANSIYTIYPNQVHLLTRAEATGLLLQFKKEVFEFLFPLQHHYLYFNHPELPLDQDQFEHLYEMVAVIGQLNEQEQLSPLSIYKSYSYLQIILITLIELQQGAIFSSQDNFAGKFLQLISLHIKEKRKVADYADLMYLTPDKLSALVKDTFATTPLKLIHEELLLEIKRLMLTSALSLKEIAYELNFDTSSNFSAFIKTATGLTPSQLQASLRRNH